MNLILHFKILNNIREHNPDYKLPIVPSGVYFALLLLSSRELALNPLIKNYVVGVPAVTHLLF